jgi:predicted histone-like DNA-binding protein
MAKLIVKKYQNKNEKSSALNKWYGRILYTETLSTEDFVKHICEHGSPFDRATIMGVLMAACDCMIELVKDSKKVRLGDLGTFYLSAGTKGEEKEEDFGADNIERLHLRLQPNHKHNYPLDSVSLRKSASFRGIEQLAGEDKENKDGEADGNEGA